jgi:hypothetical protein
MRVLFFGRDDQLRWVADEADEAGFFEALGATGFASASSDRRLALTG